MPPARSGYEFIARLTEPEHFASSHAAMNPDVYGGAADAIPRPIQRTHYLNDVVWLPFLEPAILLHNEPVTWAGPPLDREDYNENLKLAKIWDSRGLLALFDEEHPTKRRCRVFNALKNSTTDRQIGDRRWINGAECHPTGPSAFCHKHDIGALPQRLQTPWTRFKVSRSRAHSNLLPFLSLLKSSLASSGRSMGIGLDLCQRVCFIRQGPTSLCCLQQFLPRRPSWC